MSTTVTSLVRGDPAAILDRHAVRRDTGVPSVSVLVGPIGAGVGTWRRWASSNGRNVVVAERNLFPLVEWVRLVTELVDLPATAVFSLARRTGREPNDLLAALKAKTPSDCERFWHTLTPDVEDDLLRNLVTLAIDRTSPSATAVALSDLGERIVPLIARLAPSAVCPSVLFVARNSNEFLLAGREAVSWAVRVPAVPIAIVVPVGLWEEYIVTAADSRAKALLREGELVVPVMDSVTVEQTLVGAGAVGSAITAVAANGADPALLDSAVAAVRATAVPPTTQGEGDRARSAAERFLFMFLESLPETAGRFELNATLDFDFGSRPAEVDLLCRSPRVAIELDGYFHFLSSDDFRRDRRKDWELQRRGFVVLRFLTEDVIPQLETIRDRILDALTISPAGAQR